MNHNQRFSLIILAMLILTLAVLGAGCTTSVENSTNPGNTASASAAVEKVEVYHFHRTSQCYSCKTVGAYAEETVNTYFSPELASGTIVFGHINTELPENKALVDQYGPTGPSLWIGVYNETGFHKEENVNVWYKIGKKDEYMAYLKGVIEKRLAGDFSD